MACSYPLPVKSIGLIVKQVSDSILLRLTIILISFWCEVLWFLQKLLAYGAMVSHVTMLCANMQNRIIDILLNEIYCSKEYYLDRSKVIVRKACILRGSGVQNISNCLESLSEAISLLVSPPPLLVLFSYVYHKGYLRFIFLHQTSKASYWIHLKAMQLWSMNWLLHIACMHIVPRKPIMAAR